MQQQFNIFETGGRKRFLQKNKHKKTKNQSNLKTTQQIIKIQSTIRAFLGVCRFQHQYRKKIETQCQYEKDQNKPLLTRMDKMEIQNQSQSHSLCQLTINSPQPLLAFQLLSKYQLQNNPIPYENFMRTFWQVSSQKFSDPNPNPDQIPQIGICLHKKIIKFTIEYLLPTLQKRHFSSINFYQDSQKLKMIYQKLINLFMTKEQTFKEKIKSQLLLSKQHISELLRLLSSSQKILTQDNNNSKEIQSEQQISASTNPSVQQWIQTKQSLFNQLLRKIVLKYDQQQKLQQNQHQQQQQQFLSYLFNRSPQYFLYILLNNCFMKKSLKQNISRKNFIVQFFPQLLLNQSIKWEEYLLVSIRNFKNQKQDQSQTQKSIIQSLSQLYTQLMYQSQQQNNSLSKSSTKSSSTQNQLIFFAFVNTVRETLKNLHINQILSKNNINSNIFHSQNEFYDYLSEKQEWDQLKDILLLRENNLLHRICSQSNQKHIISNENNTLLETLINMVLKRQQQMFLSDHKKNNDPHRYRSEISSVIESHNSRQLLTTLLLNNNFQFILEILNLFEEGLFIDISIDKALQLLLENINEASIYSIGRQEKFYTSSTTSSVTVDNEMKILMLISLTEKICLQTTDLHFIKLFQQSSSDSNPINNLKKVCKDILLKILKHTMFLTHKPSSQNIPKIISSTINLLQNLYNKIFRTKVLNVEIFENSSFISKFKTYNFTAKDGPNQQIKTFLNKFPYVFPLQLRAAKFQQYLRIDRQNHWGHNPWMYDSDSQQDQGGFSGSVKIRRNHQFEDAFHTLKNINLKKHFKIIFINQLGLEQKGIDAGGLKKEFLNRVLKTVLNPKYGLFMQNENHQLLPHPQKAELEEGIETQQYKFIGKLIGLAIYQNITLGYQFSGTFLNSIVGKKNHFDDLKQIDPQLYKSLVYIKDMKQDAKQLQMTFLFHDNYRNKHILLKPLSTQNKFPIPVTNSNKKEYIYSIANYKVNKCLEYQSRHIRKGLTQIIHPDWMFMFNYEELNYIISGVEEINVRELRYYSRHQGFEVEQDGGTNTTIRMFWEIVEEEFSNKQKEDLLMFVTSCPRPGFLGFKEMNPPFTIIKMTGHNSEDKLPISHTCSNVLELPEYKDKEILKKKLLTAIQSNSGFEFG